MCRVAAKEFSHPCHARRAKVIPRMKANPMEYPDAIGLGPFGPCDEKARRLVLGLD